jgi:DNA polymerase-3 subunit delta
MDMTELFNSLKRGEVGRLYLFYGPEDLLMREAVGRLRELLVPASTEQMNLTVIDGGDGGAAQKIANAVETLPFMSQKRLVIVNNAVFAPAGKRGFTQADMEVLDNCIRSIPDYTCLVITARNSPDMRTKLMKTMKTAGEVVEFCALKPQVLEKWVVKRFKDAGKDISRAALKRFIFLTGYLERDSGKTLEGIANEIEKVVKYCEDRDTVRQEDIEALAPESLSMNIFKLVDTIGGRDISKALELLEDMKRGGEPPVRVLFMVARQFRLLLQASFYREMGYSGKTIASKLQLPPFVAASLMRQAGNFTREELKKKLKECGEADARVKSGRIDPWLALELLIAGL